MLKLKILLCTVFKYKTKHNINFDKHNFAMLCRSLLCIGGQKQAYMVDCEVLTRYLYKISETIFHKRAIKFLKSLT